MRAPKGSRPGRIARGFGAALLALSCGCQESIIDDRVTTPGLQASNTLPVVHARGLISPIPEGITWDAKQSELGRKLFHDPILSKDRSVSCSQCHDLDRGGTDRLARSIGIGGAEGDVNAPTVFNSAFNFAQFWDGRADSLATQMDGPIQSPKEMGSRWDLIVARLQASPDYRAAFAEAYGDGLTLRNIKNSIVEFEKSLVTPHSKLDRYLRGDASALSESESAGFAKFQSLGCISCHQGVNVGGNMFQTFGIMGDYFADRGNVSQADWGRYNVTGLEEDRFVFKVPSLRNVALTAPYFHDGSAATLEDAVRTMARYQLGREMSDGDLKDIVAFLRTLTGEYRGAPLQ